MVCGGCPPLVSLVKRASLASSFGPRRCVFKALLLLLGWLGMLLSSRSMCVGVQRGCLWAGVSSHLLICSSCPVPRYLFVPPLVVVVLASLGMLFGSGVAAFGGAACSLLSLAGSCLCSGHWCQGMPHWHRQAPIKRARLHMLHQILSSRLSCRKAVLVPGRRCVQRGHPKKMCCGSGGVGMCCFVCG